MLFHTAIILTAKGSNAFADFPPETAGSPLFRNPKDRVSRSFFYCHRSNFHIRQSTFFVKKKWGCSQFNAETVFFTPKLYVDTAIG